MIKCQLKSTECRQCYINEKRALFHRWCEEDTFLIKLNTMVTSEAAKAIRKEFKESGILPECYDSKTIHKVYALVEFEDGRIEKAEPTDVKFVDGEGLFKDYAW